MYYVGGRVFKFAFQRLVTESLLLTTLLLF